MGYYINVIDGKQLPAKGKANFILANVPGAKAIPAPAQFQEELVCVVHNAFFEGAGYCFDADEFEAFAYPDGRPRTWMIVPGAKDLAQ